MSKKIKDKDEIVKELKGNYIAEGEKDLRPDWFPSLSTISPAHLFQFLPRPSKNINPEYVYLPMELFKKQNGERQAKILVTIAEWNFAWESGHLRFEMFGDELPEEMVWLGKYADKNIYLLPKIGKNHYYSYTPLFHLLPQAVLKKHGLPMLKKGLWPFLRRQWILEELLPKDFDTRLSRAFASHIWKLIDKGSPLKAFSASDPLKLIAHNLDFWIPYAHQVIEDKVRSYGHVPLEDKRQSGLLKRIKKEMPLDVSVDRPLYGGDIWVGEAEAAEATKNIVNKANSDGRLSAIIDAIRSHRVEDDFSAKWSYAREDFERKLYHKRNRIKVRFVELKDTIPTHGSESEVENNLLWENLLALLDNKQRAIIILLRSGITKVGEISKILGYANHSPISKELARIRRIAQRLLQ